MAQELGRLERLEEKEAVIDEQIESLEKAIGDRRSKQT
jgi:hypothetical protein